MKQTTAKGKSGNGNGKYKMMRDVRFGRSMNGKYVGDNDHSEY